MWTATGLDCPNLPRRERFVAREKLSVFAREDVVRHHAEAQRFAERTTQREQQRSLATPDRATDADRERALIEVAQLRCVTLFVAAGMMPMLVRVIVSNVVAHGAPSSGRVVNRGDRASLAPARRAAQSARHRR
jgi:hypothetical protein